MDTFFTFVVLSCLLKTGFSCQGFFKGDFNSTESLPKLFVHAIPGKVKLVDQTAMVEGTGEIRMDCWAPFPIDFKFQGHLSNREATVNLERVATNYKDPSTFCFHINVTIRNFEEMTGEYACHSVQNPNLKSSYYVYYSAHPPETLLNRGQTFNVEADMASEWTIIPCPTSNPNVTVYLYNVTNERNQLNVPKSENLKYDPRIGFFIKTRTEPWGKYTCKTDVSEKDTVDVFLLPPKKFAITPPTRFLYFNEGDILKVSCESEEDITIKFDKSNIALKETRKVPKRKFTFVQEFESDKLKGGMTGIISCETKVGNKKLHEWVFQVREVRSSKLMSGGGLNPQLCGDGNNAKKLKLFDCNNWIECNMRKCNKDDRTCEPKECKESTTFNCFPSGILQCFNGQNQSAQEVIYFSGLGRNNSYTNWSLAPNHDILKIKKFKIHWKNIPLTEVSVICEGSSFVFAVGFKWFILMKDGNQLEISEEHIQKKWRNFKAKNVIRSIAKLNITTEVKEIICKAPVWNTTEWRDDMVEVADVEQGSDSSKSGIGITSPGVPLIYFISVLFCLSRSVFGFLIS